MRAGLTIGLLVAGALPWAAAQQTITPTARELNKSFDADASQWAERFEHEGRAIYDKRYEILDAMHLKPGMNAADIGAGSGLIARLMAQRVAPGGTVFAVDIARNMIDHIAKVVQQEKIPNLQPAATSRTLPPQQREHDRRYQSDRGFVRSVQVKDSSPGPTQARRSCQLLGYIAERVLAASVQTRGA